MTGLNVDPYRNLHYKADADGIVKEDEAGHRYEEVGWSNLVVNGQPRPLPQQSADFRQILSLSLDYNPKFPNLSKVTPMLIGPLTDLLTFYVDVRLAMQFGLKKPGDHAYFKLGTPESWGNGTTDIIAEDSIDFDITFKSVNKRKQEAVILVRHVPPAAPQVHLPADWMKTPVRDTPNNWVEVEKEPDGKFRATVGKETFDVEAHLSLTDGHIISATLENVVDVMERQCSDAALTQYGPAKKYRIHRRIEIR
jgi:hypothetical protein